MGWTARGHSKDKEEGGGGGGGGTPKPQFTIVILFILGLMTPAECIFKKLRQNGDASLT